MSSEQSIKDYWEAHWNAEREKMREWVRKKELGIIDFPPRKHWLERLADWIDR